MKQALKCLSLAILLSVPSLDAANSCNTSCNTSCDSNNNSVVTCIVPRSQGRNKYVQVAGSVGHTHLYDMESWYASFSITPEYTQTFRPKNITQCLFGPFVTQTPASTTVSTNSCDSSCKTSCSSRSVLVQGSTVENRSSNALVADNFYLPSDYSSVLTFSPRIRNVLVNFDLYIGLDEWLSGLYFRIYGPVTNTRWDLNFCESPVAPAASATYAAGVFAETPVTSSQFLSSFAAYASGQSPQAIGDVTFTGLQSSQILQCNRRHTGFADLRFELGWDFWMCDDYHLGINIQAAAPTGTKKKACVLFDYIIGNDKGELGGGLTGHYVFWRNESEDSHFGFYLDANVTHLFKGSENRVFDLKNKPLSRYLLAEKMQTTIADNLLAGGNTPNAQFANEFAPVANLTTQDVDVSIGAQGEIVAMFNFTWCGFSWDIGYDFWGRSCEKIKEDCDCVNASFKNNKWALKGNSQVFGFTEVLDGATPINSPVPLSATQSKATINGVITNISNAGVDNAALASALTGPTDLTVLPNNPAPGSPQINTSSTAVFIKADDIDFGQRTRGISNMIFTHLSYTWDRECWVPYLGVGAMAEFGKHEGSNCNTGTTTTTSSSSCSSCLDCAVSQWGVWVKGGISFN